MEATSASPWSSAWSSAGTSPGSRYEIASVPMTSSCGPRSGAAAIAPRPIRLADLPVLGRLGDALVGEVVGGPAHRSLGCREAVDATAQGEAHARQPVAGGLVGAAREERRDEVVGALHEQRQVRVVRAQQSERVVHDPLEDLGRFPEHGQPTRDLAQRAFLVGAACQLLTRPGELGKECRRDERRSGVVGQRAHQGRLRLAHGGVAGAVHAECADAPIAVEHRRHDHRADARALDHLVGHPGVLERGVVGVVVGDAHRPVRERRPEHADAQGHDHRAHPGPLGRVADARVGGPAQGLAAGVHEVHDRAVGVQQARRLVGRVLHGIGVAGRGYVPGPVRPRARGCARAVGGGHRSRRISASGIEACDQDRKRSQEPCGSGPQPAGHPAPV